MTEVFAFLFAIALLTVVRLCWVRFLRDRDKLEAARKVGDEDEPKCATVRVFQQQDQMPLYEVKKAGVDPTTGDVVSTLDWHLHPGQWKAYSSLKRFVLVLAGTQGGKTSFGPLWLWKEIAARGAGDYLVVTPTYPLLVKKALPEFLRLFKKYLRLGTYEKQQKIFTFDEAGEIATFGAAQEEQTQIFFGHATDPESLESATAKAVWMDEAGQKKFRVGSWEAIQRRLSINEGRALITTTPYDLGWLKQEFWDPWADANQDHATIEVVQFDSTQNPTFPQREFERARNALPPWKFDLFYRGRFTRPAGMIYGCFDAKRHKMRRIPIPPEWLRFIGLDFGGVNTAAVFFAEERDGMKPTGRLIAYREYKAGERSAAQHCFHLMRGDAKNPPEPRIPLCVGGSKSEDQWRHEFSQGGIVDGKRVTGLPVKGPVQTDVHVGIGRVWSAINLGKLVFFDDLTGLLDEIGSYSWELDEKGEPIEEIEDKETFHFCDAMRYWLNNWNVEKPIAEMKSSPVVWKGLPNL